MLPNRNFGVVKMSNGICESKQTTCVARPTLVYYSHVETQSLPKVDFWKTSELFVAKDRTIFFGCSTSGQQNLNGNACKHYSRILLLQSWWMPHEQTSRWAECYNDTTSLFCIAVGTNSDASECINAIQLTLFCLGTRMNGWI